MPYLSLLVHLLLISAAELGFAWDGAEKGWVSGFPPSFEDDDWACAAFFFSISDFQGSLQLLTSSHLRERDKMLLRAVLCGSVWRRFLSILW